MPTPNEKLLDALVQHQVSLLRFSSRLQKSLLAELEATEREIADKIRSRMLSGEVRPGSLRRLESLRKDIAKVRTRAWREVARKWIPELDALAKQESDVIALLLQGKGLKSDQLRFIVRGRPFEGKILADWAEDLAAIDIKRIGDSLKIGLVQRETGVETSRRTRRAMEIGKRNLETISRTAVNAIAGSVREVIVREGGFKRELYVAVLDSRTTAICRSLDGKIFLVGEGPIPPIHWGCRSIRVPLLSGPVPQRVSYKQWLNRQSVSTQDDILGPTRGRLFRKGGLTLDSFVDRKGKQLTLQELAQADAAAFRAAGLTPEDFLD